MGVENPTLKISFPVNLSQTLCWQVLIAGFDLSVEVVLFITSVSLV